MKQRQYRSSLDYLIERNSLCSFLFSILCFFRCFWQAIYQSLCFYLALSAFCVSSQAHPSYVKTCSNSDAGSLNFGTAPTGCDAILFGDVSRISFLYRDFVFDRSADEKTERTRYVGKMQALMREIATAYIRRRQPQWKDSQVKDWVHAIISVGSHESYLSHYRLGLDKRLKLMTGDSYDSHGLMQINQKYHSVRGQDNSFDLVGNILYGIDYFYAQLVTAAKSTCVTTAMKAGKGWNANVRAAYSLYNGGSVCRWTNGRDRWASNDKNFLSDFTEAPWKKYVENPDQKLQLKVDCLMNGDSLCAVARADRNAYLKSRPLIFDDGRTCLITGARQFTCAPDARTFQCLAKIVPGTLSNVPVRLKVRDPSFRVNTVMDRDDLCRANIPGLAKVGGFLQLRSDIRARDGIGGPVLRGLKAGSVVQVIDYEIIERHRADDKVATERYYRVPVDSGKSGWIYGGTQSDYKQWAVAKASKTPSTILFIPVPGSTIQIRRQGGLSLRDADSEIGGIGFHKVASRSQAEVIRVIVRESTNEIYLQVRSRNSTGYIYVGRTYPEVSIHQWIQVM